MRQKAETRRQDFLLKTKAFYYNFHNEINRSLFQFYSFLR